MNENLLKNKTVRGEHTEIALEIHMKETEGVLIKAWRNWPTLLANTIVCFCVISYGQSTHVAI